MGKHEQREGNPVTLVLDRLDTIIELLSFIAGPRPEGADLGIGTEMARRQNILLEYLCAAALPSAPENVRTITVGTTEILLASNESQPLYRVDVHNLNVAQPLLVSKRGVSITAGIQILARQTRPFVLPPGSELYGVVALGTIQVTVSDGYDIRPILDAVLEGGG